MVTEYQFNQKEKDLIDFSSWLLNNFRIEWNDDKDGYMWVERNPRANPVKEYDETEVYLQFVAEAI